MADAPAAQAAAPETPARAVPATPPAEAKTTETQQQQEHMIPKSRFDEVNKKYQDLVKEQQEKQKAEKQQQEQQLTEQHQFKPLYEQTKAELERIQSERVKDWRQIAAQQAKLPAEFADRLLGSTLEELVADAEKLAATLPKPAAPNINAGGGDGAAPRSGQSWWAQAGYPSKEEACARLNLNPKYQPD